MWCVENKKRQKQTIRFPASLNQNWLIRLFEKTGRDWYKKLTLLNFPKGTLFNRVNEVNPHLCHKCSSEKRAFAFIKNPDVIKKILKHLDLWDVKRKLCPTANVYPPMEGPAHWCFHRICRAARSRCGWLHQGSWLVRLRRITLQRPILKNHTRAVKLPIHKIPTF